MSFYEYIDVSRLKILENNPRTLNKRQFSTLKESIRVFPQMLEKRPIIASEELIVYGGNMRLRAAKAVGLTKVPVIICVGWSKEELDRFKLVDNLHAGTWDYDALANEYDVNELIAVGLDLWQGPDDYKPKPVKKKYVKISIDPDKITNFTELVEEVKDRTGIYDDYELYTRALTNLKKENDRND